MVKELKKSVSIRRSYDHIYIGAFCLSQLSPLFLRHHLYYSYMLCLLLCLGIMHTLYLHSYLTDYMLTVNLAYLLRWLHIAVSVM